MSSDTGALPHGLGFPGRQTPAPGGHREHLLIDAHQTGVQILGRYDNSKCSQSDDIRDFAKSFNLPPLSDCKPSSSNIASRLFSSVWDTYVTFVWLGWRRNGWDDISPLFNRTGHWLIDRTDTKEYHFSQRRLFDHPQCKVCPLHHPLYVFEHVPMFRNAVCQQSFCSPGSRLNYMVCLPGLLHMQMAVLLLLFWTHFGGHSDLVSLAYCI